MNQRTIGIVSIAAVVVLVIAAVLYVDFRPHNEVTASSTAPAAAQLQVGSQAPEFTAATTNGFFDLQKTGKPVFAEFFATWCPHCQRETATINRLYDVYKDKVDFVAIPSDLTGMDHQSNETSADVLAFVQIFHVRYPVGIFDPNLTAAKLYLQGGYPTIAVIGKDKKISYLNSGEVEYAELAKAIDTALK